MLGCSNWKDVPRPTWLLIWRGSRFSAWPFKEAEKPVTELRAKLAGEIQRQFAESIQVGAELDKLRNALSAGCPGQVDAFLEKLKEEVEHIQRMCSVEPSVSRRLALLRRTRGQVEALRTAPLATADLLTEVRRLRSRGCLAYLRIAGAGLWP